LHGFFLNGTASGPRIRQKTEKSKAEKRTGDRGRETGGGKETGYRLQERGFRKSKGKGEAEKQKVKGGRRKKKSPETEDERRERRKVKRQRSKGKKTKGERN
jgi:hypothetical protein